MPRGDGQEGKRRGKYGKGIGDGAATPEAQIFDAKVQELAAKYLAAVTRRIEKARGASTPWGAPSGKPPLPDLTAAESASLHLGQLEVHWAHMVADRAEGLLTADELKTMPATSREIRAVRAELGLATFKDNGEPIDGDDNAI